MACRRPRVAESPVANNVTSQPRETNPSAMLPATVSHAPYWRGGGRQANGERIAILLVDMVSFRLIQGSQHFREWGGHETCGVVGQTIGNNQIAVVDQSAAGINDIWHIAFTLVLVGHEQGLAKVADHLGGIVAIEKERAQAVLPHGADSMAEDQPSGIGLDGRSAVPDLDKFPGKRRFGDRGS